MKKRPGWTLERVPRMGGATGEAFVNTLQGTGMTPSSVLAREAIQNSSDAWRASLSDKIEVVFRRVTLMGRDKEEFIENLDLRGNFAARKKVLGFQQGNCLDLPKSEPLGLLYVEDFGTHGLYGDPHDPKSHFFRLLLSLGDGTKSRDTKGSGGSYGYGKSVYSANSRLHTIVAYSAFDPKDDGKHSARLMGCAYLHGHQHAGAHYSGRAWFGIGSDGHDQVVDPLHDEAAHKIARSLGFIQRDEKSRGTSILIVDCAVECSELRASIEDWWWPRMLDDSLGLDIKLVEEGKTLQPPRPRSRRDLKPFIHCFEMAIGRSMPAGDQDKTGAMNKWNNTVSPGNYGFCILDEKELEEEALQQKSGQIALVRAPRMVVSYMPIGGALPLPCVGVFVASPEVDEPLKISEPPSHDKWDPNSVRLLELAEDDRPLVKAIIDRLKTGLRKFSYEAAPPAPKQELRLRSLERMLGTLFRPPTSGGGGGGYGADPIEIAFVRQPSVVVERDGLRTAGSFRLALAEDADKRRVNVSLEVECLIVEDGGISKEDPIATTVTTRDVAYKADKEHPGRLLFKLSEGATPVFKFATDIYQPDWTTRVRVMVKEVL